MLNFRFLRIGMMAASVAAAGLLMSNPVLSAAPELKTNPPGFYRVMVGDIEVTALSDGTTNLPPDKILSDTKPEVLKKELAKSYLPNPIETSFNGFLVNTGTKLVLIDTGAGNFFGPTLGNLANSLKAAGYQPEQVDEVYITHFHSDHIGGLLNGDKAAFPNAIVRADKHESDYWLSQANLDKAPKDNKDSFIHAQAALKPYVDTGKFKPIEGNGELVAGVSSQSTFGHTPGHTSYVVESKGQKLVVWGDLIHVAAVQLAHPDAKMQFDSDSKAGMAQRKKTYAEAAKEGYIVAGAHISFPGLGRLRADGTGYVWVPVNY
ncbi:MAG TPA: MBL fold metallo-hydrolase, partial [Burkholderiaceae bacterium]|nr:MBL fold metallo-hydrolase [Burkholderiaceae bacterium]